MSHSGQPQAVYCHGCHCQWQQQQHEHEQHDGRGIECPTCQSSSTEIITLENDPRHFHNPQPQPNPSQNVNPPAPSPAPSEPYGHGGSTPAPAQAQPDGTAGSSNRAPNVDGSNSNPNPAAQQARGPEHHYQHLTSLPFLFAPQVAFFTTLVGNPQAAPPSSSSTPGPLPVGVQPAAFFTFPLHFFSPPTDNQGAPIPGPDVQPNPQQGSQPQPQPSDERRERPGLDASDGARLERHGMDATVDTSRLHGVEHAFHGFQQHAFHNSQHAFHPGVHLASQQEGEDRVGLSPMMGMGVMAALVSSLFQPPANPVPGDGAFQQIQYNLYLDQLATVMFSGVAPAPTQLHGASRTAIESLAVKEIDETMMGDETGTTECGICQEERKLGDKVTVLPCNPKHFFDSECITTWLNMNNSCPMCRKPIDEKAPNVATPNPGTPNPVPA